MPTDPAIIILLGITGDLSRRKLLPALYQLHQDNRLHAKTIILGSSRRDVAIADVLQAAQLPEPIPAEFAQRFRMTQFNPSVAADHQQLKQQLEAIEQEQAVAMQRIFYLSIPPESLSAVAATMGQTGLATPQTKIMIEKPYGRDLASAQTLTANLAAIFPEDRIFRIDHYAAKEMVQNITVFRQHNYLFNNLLNNQYVANIYVRAHEQLDIEGRADFYEQAGALRDLIQSHLLQILANATMLLPDTAEPTAAEFHAARLDFLRSLVPPTAEQIAQRAVRGQYDGYRAEANQPDSQTETFAAIELFSTDPRWKGVSFILESGKALSQKVTDVTVVFKATDITEKAAQLVFSIDPDHHITLTARVKQPGFTLRTHNHGLQLNLDDAFTDERHPEAYERVFYDALRGDQSLFISADEALASWAIVQPILTAWQANGDDLQTYAKGSAGPSLQPLRLK